MQSAVHVGVAVSLAFLAASAPAAAAPKPITGKLSKPGYTVIVLATDGEASSKPTMPNGKFKLRPPAKRGSLHLRAADGTYAGPIVIARKGRNGRKVILGVEAGAELGKVRVRAGYAKLKRELPDADVDRKRTARASKGVPIGARVFGRVVSAAAGTAGPGEDLDRDGIPGALDIDDDGDLVLDNLDHPDGPSGPGAARADGGCGPSNFYCQAISSSLAPGNLEGVENVSAGSTAEQIDATLAQSGVLRFSPVSESEELDCGGEPDPANPDGWIGGLSYCTRGGTGVASAGGSGPPFPGPPGGQFDPDGDGFGTVPKPAFLAPRASTAALKTGDVIIQRVTGDGTEAQYPATVNFVFATVPALVSYSDTAGHSATVSYPVAPGGLGTAGNGFPVSAPAGQDVVVTLTFWRPQRQAIPDSDPPAATWMDIGHLTYSASPAVAGGCPQAAFSTTDPSLAPPALPLLGTGGLADSEDDQQASPGNTLTYSLNLSQCLAANGLPFSPGDEQNFIFKAVAGASDFAQTGAWFRRQ